MICDESVEADTLKAVIAAAPAQVIIEDVALFDVFRGGSVPAGKKSMAYTFTLRAEDRTLNDEDIQAATQCILGALEQAGASLRS